MKPKIRILACADNFHFIKDLIPALSDEFDIKIANPSPGAGWKDFISSDVIWLEWADGKPLKALEVIRQSNNLKNTKTVLKSMLRFIGQFEKSRHTLRNI